MGLAWGRGRGSRRRGSEREAGAVEEQFYALGDALSFGVVVQDAETGAITLANPAAERLLSLTLEQLQGKTSADPHWRAVDESGEPLPGERHPSMRALATGKPVLGFIMGIYTGTEMARWILVDAIPVAGADGRIREVVSNFIDVTDRRRAEVEREQHFAAAREARAATEAARARLAQVFAQAPVAIAVLSGPRHVCESLNAPYRAIIGDREVVGLPARQAMPEMEGQGFFERLDRVYATGERFVGREMLVRYDRHGAGSLESGYFDFVFEPLREQDGKVSGIVVVVMDVTEQLLERLEAGRVADRAARLQVVTAALGQTLSPREVVEVALREGLPAMGASAGGVAELTPDGTEFVLLHAIGYSEEILAAFPRFSVSIPAPTRDVARMGEPVFVSSRAEWVAKYGPIGAAQTRLGNQAWATYPLAASGRTLGVLMMSYKEEHEFTPEERAFAAAIAHQCAQALERARLLEREQLIRRDAESARAEAEAARLDAEAANAAKSQFLATMSHEIRTPINAMLGYTQLLEIGVAGPVSEQQREYLARIQQSSAHLLSLIDEILDLSKVDAGRIALAREHVMTGVTVSAAVALMLPQARAKDVRLLHADAGTPSVPYIGDDQRARQILVNMLSNAVKFTPAGGTVTVRCGILDRDTPPSAHLAGRGRGRWTYLQVEDTGIGIASAQRSKIFEPFHQAEGGHTRRAGGTGLGLAISRRLARLMDGDLTFESEQGQGSTFTLWLPTTEQRDTDVRADIQPEETARRVPGLAEAGYHLRAEAERTLAAFVARIRNDPEFGVARSLHATEIEDQLITFLGNLAQSLIIVERSRGHILDALKDGGEIQRIIADLHGRQRHRLGWTEAQIEREYDILAEEIEVVLRQHIRDHPGDTTAALEIVRHLIARARKTSARSHRQVAMEQS